MRRTMRTNALLLAAALLTGTLAVSPASAQSGDAYAYQRSGGGAAGYSYRSETSERDGAPVQGQVNCQGYCLPPGYTIEDPNGPRDQPAPQPPVHDAGVGHGYVAEPVYQDEEVRTGGGLVYAEREDRYGARRTYEERGGYSWGYEAREERHDEGRGDWGREPCRQRLDDRGRVIESCGEIRLSDSFFWGGGGVGPEYIDAGGGGGGGGYVEAGAGASAYASARASVGVSVRIGGRGGHKGGGKGGHGGKGGGCGCKH